MGASHVFHVVTLKSFSCNLALCMQRQQILTPELKVTLVHAYNALGFKTKELEMAQSLKWMKG